MVFAFSLTPRNPSLLFLFLHRVGRSAVPKIIRGEFFDGLQIREAFSLEGLNQTLPRVACERFPSAENRSRVEDQSERDHVTVLSLKPVKKRRRANVPRLSIFGCENRQKKKLDGVSIMISLSIDRVRRSTSEVYSRCVICENTDN